MTVFFCFDQTIKECLGSGLKSLPKSGSLVEHHMSRSNVGMQITMPHLLHSCHIIRNHRHCSQRLKIIYQFVSGYYLHMKNATLLFFLALSGFAGSAQTFCDSVNTTEGYAAFNDSSIVINVASNYTGPYPNFTIFNSNGDTVAKEKGGTYPIYHLVKIRPGTITSNTFSGVMHTRALMKDSLMCIQQKTFKLCPDTCIKVFPRLSNSSGQIFLGSVSWEIKDNNQQSFGTGIFTFTSTTQHGIDSVCLKPGIYSMYITPGTLSGNPLVADVWLRSQYFVPHAYASYLGSPLQIPFNFYTQCMFPAAVVNSAMPAPSITAFGGKLYVNNGNSEIGIVLVSSVEGKVLYRAFIKNSVLERDFSELQSGIYLVKVINSKGQTNRKVYFNL